MRRLTTALLLLLAPLGASASVSYPYPGPGKDQNLLFGAQAWYQVVLRTEGSSVVTGRVVLPNDPDSGFLRELNVDLGVEPRDLTVYYEQRSTCSTAFDTQPTEACPYSGYENAAYTKLTPEVVGSKLKLTLPETPSTATSAGVLMSFASTGYTKERVGRFSYEVSSPKLDVRTYSVSMSLSVDPGVYISDKRANVQAGSTQAEMGLAPQGSVASSRDAALKSVADSISYSYGSVYESANSLTAGDVLTMRGYLSETRFFLEMPRYASALGAFLIAGALMAMGLSVLRRRRPEAAANLRPVVWASFLGAAGTVLLSNVLASASSWFGLWQFLVPFMIVTLFAAFAALVLLPSLLVGFAKRSWVLGMSTFGAQVLWSLIFLLIFSLAGMQTGGQGPILY